VRAETNGGCGGAKGKKKAGKSPSVFTGGEKPRGEGADDAQPLNEASILSKANMGENYSKS